MCERKHKKLVAISGPYLSSETESDFIYVSRDAIYKIKAAIEASLNTALLGGLTLNFLFEIGGQYMWSLINGFQFYPFLLVMDLEFPYNCGIVLRGFEMANFDLVEFFIQSPIS